MRMWMVDPSKMCRQHLLGEHKELHMLVGTLKAGKSIAGYLNSGLVEVHNIKSRHAAIVKEMKKRNYNHKSPLDFKTSSKLGEVNRIQSFNDLISRCPECYNLNKEDIIDTTKYGQYFADQKDEEYLSADPEDNLLPESENIKIGSFIKLEDKIGKIMSKFYWHTRGAYAGDVLLNDGRINHNFLFKGVTIMTKEELDNLNKVELNNMLGGKYKSRKLQDMKKETLIEEVTQKIDSEIPRKKTKNNSSNNSKPGVISEIIRIASESPATKYEIADELAKIFPDRNRESMIKTVAIQLGNRLKNKYEIEVSEKDVNGKKVRYYHIESEKK